MSQYRSGRIVTGWRPWVQSGSRALLDLVAQRLTFYRIAYDHLAVAREMRTLGLPEVLATRLENGQ